MITRQTQQSMKEQQKITRRQELERSTEASTSSSASAYHSGPMLSPSQESNPVDFPRREELERETRDIIDEDLFRRINEICRPRGQNQPSSSSVGSLHGQFQR